ncbi:hypothetical protein BKA66DRAFT_513945 [Pyrenochaeta sp. MPI-SDFR-AT-0127]|nr:hypothetical protein BKA66DRAFT_513945 [Pyrenochaeta sp. MPI-SDFR-AT-0127]
MDLSTGNNSDLCYITQISTELVLQIIDHIPPASHFDFARTCKRILACSSDVFKRHHDAFTKYHVSSDLEPETVPTLLRSAFGYSDPIPAWYVRSFEIWYDRESWKYWKTIKFDTMPSDDNENEPKSWKFLYGEWEDYLEPLEYGNGTSEHLETARVQMEDGFDGILKAVLLANCPRLRNVKFVTPGVDRALDDTSCLGWLELFIQDAVRGANPWPCGLANLQSVAVGIPSETWMSLPFQNQPQTYGPSNTSLLLQLLRLPNIESIYFKDYMRDPDNETDYSDLLPKRCSSVKHLFLDNCDELGHSFREALIEAPVGLLTASFRAGNALLEHADSIVSGLREQQQSLTSLMFYGYSEGGIHGYRCSAFRPEEIRSYHSLRYVSIDIQDVELDAYYDEDSKEEEETNSDYIERFFAECFPMNMETLTLWGELSSSYITWEPSQAAGLENAIIKLIEEQGNLKAVFLEDVERVRGSARPHTDMLWFQKVIELGKEYDVDVHTLTNRNKMMHEIDFPEAPDQYDLVTGPWGKRPEDWVFSVYSGRRGPPGSPIAHD